jgi:hypothetical protein
MGIDHHASNPSIVALEGLSTAVVASGRLEEAHYYRRGRFMDRRDETVACKRLVDVSVDAVSMGLLLSLPSSSFCPPCPSPRRGLETW